MATRKIIVFTQPDSLPCEAVKLFLRDRKARFEERKYAKLTTTLCASCRKSTTASPRLPSSSTTKS